MKSGVTVTLDKVADTLAALRFLDENRVMIGVPSSKAGRRDDGPINNAAIGFIQENGDPAMNLPARPFLIPGVKGFEPEAIRRFKDAGTAALSGDPKKAERQLNAIGLLGASAVKTKLNTGPFAPLSPRTIAQRAAQRGTKRRKSETKYLDLVAGGTDPAQAQAEAGIKPLLNTLQLLNAITYVIRRIRGKINARS